MGHIPNLPPMVVAKICGLTRTVDAAEAARLGAGFLGVIFAGGPRQVESGQAAEIVAASAGIPVIGVFGSQGIGEILGCRDATGIAGAQLHGGATPRQVGALRREGLIVFPVVRLREAADLVALDAFRSQDCPVLVEPRVEGRLGGSGTALPLELALAARARLAGRRMILAGGLTPETVAEAVRIVRPEVVDVSSGVEQIPGTKDHHRMAQFMENLAWA